MKGGAGGLLSAAGRLRERLGPLHWHGLVLFAIWRVGDVANLVYRFVLGRRLSALDFGAVDPVLSTIAVLSIPVAIVYRIATKSISRLLAQERGRACAGLIRDLMKLAAAGSVLAAAAVFALRGYLLERLHIDGGGVFVPLLAGLFVLAWWQPLFVGVLQGGQKYWLTAIPTVAGPAVLLVATLVLVVALDGGLAGALLARVLAPGVSCLLLLAATRGLYAGPRESYADEWPVMRAMLAPTAVMVAAGQLMMNFDRLFVRNFLLEHSGGYMAVVTLGQIPMWIIGPLGFVIFPLASAEHARGGRTRRLYWQGAGAGLALSLVCAGLLAAAAPAVFRFWQPAFSPYARYVWIYALATGAQAIGQLAMSVELARHRYGFLWCLVVPAASVCAGLYLARNTIGVGGVAWAMAGAHILTLVLLLALGLTWRGEESAA